MSSRVYWSIFDAWAHRRSCCAKGELEGHMRFPGWVHRFVAKHWYQYLRNSPHEGHPGGRWGSTTALRSPSKPPISEHWFCKRWDKTLQIDLHPFMVRSEIVDFSRKHGMVLEVKSRRCQLHSMSGSWCHLRKAWGPLVRGYRFNHPTILALARKHKKEASQILIRYSLQKVLTYFHCRNLFLIRWIFQGICASSQILTQVAYHFE